MAIQQGLLSSREFGDVFAAGLDAQLPDTCHVQIGRSEQQALALPGQGFVPQLQAAARQQLELHAGRGRLLRDGQVAELPAELLQALEAFGIDVCGLQLFALALNSHLQVDCTGMVASDLREFLRQTRQLAVQPGALLGQTRLPEGRARGVVDRLSLLPLTVDLLLAGLQIETCGLRFLAGALALRQGFVLACIGLQLVAAQLLAAAAGLQFFFVCLLYTSDAADE